MGASEVLMVISAITATATTGVMGVIWFDIRTIKAYVTKEVDKMSDKHHACQRELPDKYAGKNDTKEVIKDIWNHIDKTETEIAYLKGRTNGAGG